MLFSSLTAQETNNIEKIGLGEKPPLRNGTVAKGIASGTFGGVIVGLGGVCVGQLIDAHFDPFNEHPHALVHYEQILGFWVGYILGSSIGVYGYRTKEDIEGSYFATLLGSIAGGLLFAIPAPVGATIGFNQTRRYKAPTSNETGFINYSQGNVDLIVPSIYNHMYLLYGLQRTSVNLVTVRF